MAGGGGIGGGRGGRRKLHDNLNLVPFVDLFSTMIIFLLATAVWDQLSSIKANLAAGGGDANITMPQDQVKKVEASVKLSVTATTVDLFDAGKRQSLPIRNGVFDVDAVKTFVEAARERHPDKSDVVIEASDTAKYEHLIAVMDQALAQDFSDLVITGSN